MEAVVLRRTADVNARYLPPLTSFVVFCRPSPIQARTCICCVSSNLTQHHITPVAAIVTCMSSSALHYCGTRSIICNGTCTLKDEYLLDVTGLP